MYPDNRHKMEKLIRDMYPVLTKLHSCCRVICLLSPPSVLDTNFLRFAFAFLAVESIRKHLIVFFQFSCWTSKIHSIQSATVYIFLELIILSLSLIACFILPLLCCKSTVMYTVVLLVSLAIPDYTEVLLLVCWFIVQGSCAEMMVDCGGGRSFTTDRLSFLRRVSSSDDDPY